MGGTSRNFIHLFASSLGYIFFFSFLFRLHIETVLKQAKKKTPPQFKKHL